MILILEDDAVRVMSVRGAVSRAQAIVKEYIPSGARLTEELLADRRADAANE